MLKELLKIKFHVFTCVLIEKKAGPGKSFTQQSYDNEYGGLRAKYFFHQTLNSVLTVFLAFQLWLVYCAKFSEFIIYFYAISQSFNTIILNQIGCRLLLIKSLLHAKDSFRNGSYFGCDAAACQVTCLTKTYQSISVSGSLISDFIGLGLFCALLDWKHLFGCPCYWEYLPRVCFELFVFTS